VTPLPAGIRLRRDRNAVQASLWLGGARYQRTIARLDELAALPESRWPAFLAGRKDAALRALAAEGPARRTHPGRTRFSTLWQEFVDAAAATRRTGTLAHYARTPTPAGPARNPPRVRVPSAPLHPVPATRRSRAVSVSLSSL